MSPGEVTVAARKRMSMRERISIERPLYETDSYGQRKITGWETMEVVPASWEHTGGSETFRGRQIEPSIFGVFTIREPREFEVSPTYRVIHINKDRRILNVHSTRPFESNLEGGFKYVELLVKAIDDA
jgi:head-tail adaptor